MGEKSGQIMSVGKTFEILEELKKSAKPLTLGDLSERTGFPKSTLYGLLNTMREYGAIDQDESGRYSLGIYLYELGHAVERKWNIIDIAKPYLKSIQVTIDETVCIAVLDSHTAMVIDSVSSDAPIRMSIQTGARLPLHASALGKVMLAYMAPEERETALIWSPMKAYTPHTITNDNRMKFECASVLSGGYAVEDGEMYVGMRSVAAPIFDANGKVKYAVAVTGMFVKPTDPDFRRAIRLVTSAAAAISAKMK